MNDSFTLINEG